jgi:Ca2+ transporting ATPase
MKADKAGVSVKMVTGDNVETATAIAKEANILPPTYKKELFPYAVMEGPEFRSMIEFTEDPTEEPEEGENTDTAKAKKIRPKKVRNLEKFKEITDQLHVLSRSTPEDKFMLVTGLMQLDNCVAVTGDGANDAPALRKANVGLAMNLVGTDVAKEAADIILIDDNFCSIITAVKWGRNIYDCVRKFIQFQLTVNIVALALCFVGAVLVHKSPLTAV